MNRHAASSSNPKDRVSSQLEELGSLAGRLANEEAPRIRRMAGVIVDSYRGGGKILICGNGGSAADAQHMAGELVGRFLKERRPLGAISLATDTSVLTAIGNDYGFDSVFSRQVAAHGREGDVLFAISTSGNSPNVVKAVEEARGLKMKSLALSGRDGGALAKEADICITIPSDTCPRIQEAHAAVIHVICDLVERTLFGEKA